jgi:hypothetical protein
MPGRFAAAVFTSPEGHPMKRTTAGRLLSSAALGAALVLPYPVRPAHAQWSPMNGPFGGHVQAIATSGSTLVIGTHGAGAWRSTNGGVSWTPAGPGISTPFV